MRVIDQTEGGSTLPGVDRRRWHGIDALLALGVLAICEQEVWAPIGRGFSRRVGPSWVFALTVAIASAALLWRRAQPLITVCVVNAALVGYYLAFGAPEGLATLLLPLVALYAAGRYGSLPVLWASTALTAGTLAVHTVREKAPALPLGPTILFWAATLGSGPFGLLLANRSRRIETLAAEAATLQRDRAADAAEAVLAERGRISRELHDLVGHGISLIVLQAEGAQAVLETGRVDAAAARLYRLSETARATMAEMRRLLSVVGEESAPLHPEPGLGQIPALVESWRVEGLPVELCLEDATTAIPASVGIAAYRVVQEALTNVVKHAGPATPASVYIGRTGDRLTVRVSDRGRRNDCGPIGRGLSGMRERVGVLGGDLNFGPQDAGGFTVTATLPLVGLAR